MLLLLLLKRGYLHVDCAQIYGNEKEIGLVLKKLFQDDVVKREDLWITYKLWGSDHEPEDVPVALDRTLRCTRRCGYATNVAAKKVFMALCCFSIKYVFPFFIVITYTY